MGERGGVGGGEWERGEEGEGGEGGRGRGGRMDGWREGGRSLEGRWEGREGGREMGPSPHAQTTDFIFSVIFRIFSVTVCIFSDKFQ